LHYVSVADSMALSSTTLTQLAPEATKFSRITQNNGHYAVQDHSRSPMSASLINA